MSTAAGAVDGNQEERLGQSRNCCLVFVGFDVMGILNLCMLVCCQFKGKILKRLLRKGSEYLETKSVLRREYFDDVAEDEKAKYDSS